MNDRIRKMLKHLLNYARPDFDLGSDQKLNEADKACVEIQQRRKELERRLELLNIQGTPRGSFHG